MRYLAIIIAFASSSMSFAQEWQTVQNSDFGEIYTWFGGGNTGASYFNVNPYTQELWMANGDEITRIDNLGNLHRYNSSNTPSFSTGQFMEFAFTSTNTYAVNQSDGVFIWNGTNWGIVSGIPDGIHISRDTDTVWVTRTSGNILEIQDITPTFHNSSWRRLQSKNGTAWVSSSAGTGIATTIIRYYPNETFVLYNPDTVNYLLDWSNHDFKFSKNSDSLYVAGDLGFSIAYNDSFVDTLTIHNTINMPGTSIAEFEFDGNDNIWALFGTDMYDVSHLARYNKSTNTWDMIYDGNNSPIDFSVGMSLEVDDQGNVWVAQGQNFHVLKMNNWPTWLATEELMQNQFTIYPNPSQGTIHINNSEGVSIDKVVITHTDGSIAQTMTIDETLSLNVSEGVYFVHLYSENALIGIERIVLVK